MDGTLVSGDCRGTLGYGAGDRATLGDCAGLTTLGDVSCGGILGDSADSVIFKGARLAGLLRVGGSIGGDNRIGRRGC